VAQISPIIAAGKLPLIAKKMPTTAHSRPAREQILGRSLIKDNIVG
jgi:hypothetical protein